MNNVNSTKINQSIRSHHKVVSLIIIVNATEWGQGYWKINNDILNDNKYVNFNQKIIREFRINNRKGRVSPNTSWESLKCVIRGERIKHCAEKKKN